MSDEYDQVIQSAYQAFLTGQGYDVFLANVAQFTGGHQAAVINVDGTSKTGFILKTHNIDPEFFRLYNERYGQLDPRRAEALSTRKGDVLLAQEVKSNSELEKSEYTNDIIKPFDQLDALFGAFDGDEKVGTSGLTVYRGFKDELYSRDDAQKLKSVLGHLENARNIAQTIGKTFLQNSEMQSYEGKLVLIVKRDLSFEPLGDDWRFFWEQAGIFNLSYAQLKITPMALDAKIQSMLLGAFDKQIGASIRYQTQRGKKLVIRVSPVMEEIRNMLGHFNQDVAIIEVNFQSNNSVLNHNAFQHYFSLTNTEYKVLLSFSQTFNLKETATKLNVKYETVRWHFKHVLEKTDSRNQAELISKLHQYSMT